MIRYVAFAAGIVLLSGGDGLAEQNASAAAKELPECPARYRVLNEPPGAPFECLCTKEIQTREGTVKLYGSGPYDSISNICIAAVHAGATPPEGGPVRVIPRPPEDSFVGSIQNGVGSSDWGVSLFNTFDIEAAGAPG